MTTHTETATAECQGHVSDNGPHVRPGRYYCVGICTAEVAGDVDMTTIAERYTDAKTCECGALIECLDGGGYSYWVHVKRMRIDYDHAAVPKREGSRAEFLDELIEKVRDYGSGFDGEPMAFFAGIDAAVARLEHAKWEEQ